MMGKGDNTQSIDYGDVDAKKKSFWRVKLQKK
jgi:hypothetical protein